MSYTADDGEKYQLNLIDTPGHVDFSYEVSRSLRACEGVLLLVDASQGVEAQTVAHNHLAQSLGLKIIPVINKVDLSQADADSSEEQLWEILHDTSSAERVSAKTGLGIHHLLERIVHDIPAPAGKDTNPLSALIFDSYYDAFRGVIAYIRVVEGTLKPGMWLEGMHNEYIGAIMPLWGWLALGVSGNYFSSGQIGETDENGNFTGSGFDSTGITAQGTAAIKIWKLSVGASMKQAREALGSYSTQVMLKDFGVMPSRQTIRPTERSA